MPSRAAIYPEDRRAIDAIAEAPTSPAGGATSRNTPLPQPVRGRP